MFRIFLFLAICCLRLKANPGQEHLSPIEFESIKPELRRVYDKAVNDWPYEDGTFFKELNINVYTSNRPTPKKNIIVDWVDVDGKTFQGQWIFTFCKIKRGPLSDAAQKLIHLEKILIEKKFEAKNFKINQSPHQIWTSKSGSSIEGRLVAHTGVNLTLLRKTGKEIKVSISSLSPESIKQAQVILGAIVSSPEIQKFETEMLALETKKRQLVKAGKWRGWDLPPIEECFVAVARVSKMKDFNSKKEFLARYHYMIPFTRLNHRSQQMALAFVDFIQEDEEKAAVQAAKEEAAKERYLLALQKKKEWAAKEEAQKKEQDKQRTNNLKLLKAQYGVVNWSDVLLDLDSYKNSTNSIVEGSFRYYFQEKHLISINSGNHTIDVYLKALPKYEQKKAMEWEKGTKIIFKGKVVQKDKKPCLEALSLL